MRPMCWSICSRIRAPPASQALGSTNPGPECRSSKAAALSAAVREVTRPPCASDARDASHGEVEEASCDGTAHDAVERALAADVVEAGAFEEGAGAVVEHGLPLAALVVRVALDGAATGCRDEVDRPLQGYVGQVLSAVALVDEDARDAPVGEQVELVLVLLAVTDVGQLGRRAELRPSDGLVAVEDERGVG